MAQNLFVFVLNKTTVNFWQQPQQHKEKQKEKRAKATTERKQVLLLLLSSRSVKRVSIAKLKLYKYNIYIKIRICCVYIAYILLYLTIWSAKQVSILIQKVTKIITIIIIIILLTKQTRANVIEIRNNLQVIDTESRRKWCATTKEKEKRRNNKKENRKRNQKLTKCDSVYSKLYIHIYKYTHI